LKNAFLSFNAQNKNMDYINKYKRLPGCLRSLQLLLFVLLSAIGLTGCTKFVQIDPPTTQLITASTFNNNATATAALLGIYTEMMSNGESYNMAEYSGLLSDELTNYSSSQNLLAYYHNAMYASVFFGPWMNAYNYIYQANAIKTALQNNSALTPAVAKQLTGEAEFVRAFWYFYLTACYGDIPFTITTSYSNNATLSRTTSAQVYQQIIADLKDAQNLLNSNYVDGTDTTIITTDRGRPTQWAAAAMLARVYLYMGDYTDAKTQATAVINNTGLYGLDSLNNTFLTGSAEAIWQLDVPQPSNNSNATPDGSDFILLTAPSTNGVNCSTISPQLLNSFELNDNRKTNWIGYYATGSDTFYFPYKYKNSGIINTGLNESVMVLRLGEQYLIRSEAEANLGDMIDAAADLNMIRARAGLLPSTMLTASSNLLQADTAIMHERQVELFTEWGHRWFDLIRTNNVNAVMSIVTPIKSGGAISWSPTDSLYPIPQSERSVDPNLTQNPGY
jgi:starch-binding outer membrane protein, SusD/RagB family